MFCSNCGTPATGNFCSSCGTPLNNTRPPETDSSRDTSWHDSVLYDVVIMVPEVRERITAHSRMAPNKMTSEQWMELFDKAYNLAPGVSLSKINSVSQPVYQQMGIKTGKARTSFLTTPSGKVLAAILCSLARRGHKIRDVKQGEDGCLFEAALSSDLWSNEGTLVIKLEKMEKGVLVEAETVIKGQIFDWGKSNRILNDLFNDVAAESAGL
jgi:hypothetical protein